MDDKHMSVAQRSVLQYLAAGTLHAGYAGYSALQEKTGIKSASAVYWVLNALERRGYVQKDGAGDYSITVDGAAALTAILEYQPGYASLKRVVG